MLRRLKHKDVPFGPDEGAAPDLTWKSSRRAGRSVCVCVYRVQRGLSIRDVPFGPDEGAARYSGLKGIQECAWSMHSVAVQA